MNDHTETLDHRVGLMSRQLRDVNALCGNIQHIVRSLREPRASPRPGGLVARYAVCAVKAFLELRTPESVAREFYPTDRELGQLVARTVSSPAASTPAAWAGELLAITVADILTNILPESVLRQLRQRSGMEFTFVDGSIVRLPYHSAQPSGSFVAESLPIPVASLLLSSLPMPVRKCASISAFSRELASGTAVNVEQAFRILLEQDLGLAVDAILLDGNAATTVRPAGLLNGLTGLTPSATGTLTDKIAADVRTLLTAVAPAVLPTLIVSTVEAAVLDAVSPGLAKIASVSVPPGKVLCVDASAFVSALGPPTFDVSENPLVHMEDVPLPITSGSTGSAIVAAPSMSMWQADATGLRCLIDVNWALRRANAVSYMTGVGW
jgi:Phage capsid family